MPRFSSGTRLDVSIEPYLAALFPMALRDWRWAGLCSCGDRGHPGVPGEGVADGGDDVRAVLARGVDVAADGVPVAGRGLGAEPSGDLLLGFRRPQVALGLVGGGGIRRSVRKRRTSASRFFRHSSSMRPGFCFAFAPGTRRNCARPTRTAFRKSRRSPAAPSSGTAARPSARAAFAAWMRARSASAVRPGQMAPGYTWAASSRSRRMCWCTTGARRRGWRRNSGSGRAR